MARALINAFADPRSGDVESLKEEGFPPDEIEAIRQSVLRLRRLTTAYESRYEEPYLFTEPFDVHTYRRHFEGYR